MSSKVDELIEILASRGTDRYGDEAVSQLQHALQCAALAERSGADSATIAAALLHDIGHLVDKHSEGAAAAGRDRQHEKIGQGYLNGMFGPAVVEPVRMHVDAKRYLCAVDPGYHATLSFASQRSLALQGGPFTADAAEEFASQPFAEQAVEVRRWDDLAKDPSMSTPDLEHFRPHLEKALEA